MTRPIPETDDTDEVVGSDLLLVLRPGRDLPASQSIADVLASGTSDLLDAEGARDAIAAFIAAGDNITVVHNDAQNTLTISSTATGGTPFLTTVEEVDEADRTLTRADRGKVIALTPLDAGNTITLWSDAQNGDVVAAVKFDNVDGPIIIEDAPNNEIYRITEFNHCLILIFDGVGWVAVAEYGAPDPVVPQDPALEKILQRISPIHDAIETTTFATVENAQVALVGHGTYNNARIQGLTYHDDMATVPTNGSYGTIFRVPSNEVVNNPVAVLMRGTHTLYRLATGWVDRGVHGNFRYYVHRGAYATGDAVSGESLEATDTVHIEGTATTSEVIPEWDGAIEPDRILTGVSAIAYTAATGDLTATLVSGDELTTHIAESPVTGPEAAVLEEADAYQRQKLNAEGITSTIGAFADATAADLANGYGFIARTVVDGPSVESDPYVLPQGAPPNGVGVTPTLQLPRGVNPDRCRLQHIRSDSVLETLPRSTDEWRQLAGRNVAEGQWRFTDQYDAVVSADLPLVVHDTFEMRAGDIVKLQIAPETFTASSAGPVITIAYGRANTAAAVTIQTASKQVPLNIPIVIRFPTIPANAYRFFEPPSGYTLVSAVGEGGQTIEEWDEQSNGRWTLGPLSGQGRRSETFVFIVEAASA